MDKQHRKQTTDTSKSSVNTVCSKCGKQIAEETTEKINSDKVKYRICKDCGQS